MGGSSSDPDARKRFSRRACALPAQVCALHLYLSNNSPLQCYTADHPLTINLEGRLGHGAPRPSRALPFFLSVHMARRTILQSSSSSPQGTMQKFTVSVTTTLHPLLLGSDLGTIENAAVWMLTSCCSKSKLNFGVWEA